MKESTSQFTLRLAQSLRSSLEDAANERGRSLQQEITERLLESFGVRNDSDVRMEQIARRVFAEEMARASGALVEAAGKVLKPESGQ